MASEYMYEACLGLCFVVIRLSHLIDFFKDRGCPSYVFSLLPDNITEYQELVKGYPQGTRQAAGQKKHPLVDGHFLVV